LQKQLEQLDHQLAEISDELTALEKSVGSLSSSISNQNLDDRIAVLEKENLSLAQRLQEGKSASNKLSKKDAEKIDKILEVQVSLWRKRKRSATDVLNGISEGKGVTMKSLFNEMGLESDEDHRFSINDISSLLEPPSKKRK